MYTELVVPMIRTECPKGMNEANCPLRYYLKNCQTIFDISWDKSYLIPTTNDVMSLMWTFIKMQKFCAECKAENKQNTRTR